MDKITYLAELAEGLARWVPERERQDILRYYAEYFEEAGPEREAQVVAELGDPWALSCRLAVEGGFVTQEQANSWKPPKRKRKFWMLAAGITAAVLLFTVVSIASMASQVGRIVGKIAGVGVDQVAYYGEAEDFGVSVEEFGAQVAEVVPGVTFFDVKDGIVGEGFWNMEDGYLEPFEEIDVDVSMANVTVTPGEDYTLFIDSDTALGGYSLKWEVKNGVLKIRDGSTIEHAQINSWQDFKNVFGIGARAVDVVITVPDGEPLNRFRVKAGLGNVFLSQLYVENGVEAETGLGGVECHEVRAWDEVELESGMGDIILSITEVYSGARFEAKTGMGTVEANVDYYEKDWDYKAETGMGTVTVNEDSKSMKAEHKGNGDYKLELESGMGDVKLCFKDDRW